MRNRQLRQLMASFRAEIGQSLSVNAGKDTFEADKELLASVQEELYEEFFWPFLRITPTVAIGPGQRYFQLPDTMALEGLEHIYPWESGRVREMPLDRGIEPKHYAIYNSENAERASPLERWDVASVDDDEMIELWPIPAQAETIQLAGKRKLRPLLADSDTADLDDKLIVLYAAAKRLAKTESKDAEMVLARAQRRKDRLQANARGNPPPVRFGLGPTREQGRGHVTIRIAGAA